VAAVRTASDALLAEALDALLDAVSPTFLTAFLLPALVRRPSPGDASANGRSGSEAFFLLPDARLSAAIDANAQRLAWARHRQLYLPLLVRLQRRFPGFSHALYRRLLVALPPPDGGDCGYGYGRWVGHLKTRDWHSHFPHGRHEALFALRRAPGISFNLRDKPPENWTQPETEFMLGPASVNCVQRGLGLNPEEVLVGQGGVTVDGEEEEETEDWARCEDWGSCPIGSEL
jgi:hypothetical protein